MQMRTFPGPPVLRQISVPLPSPPETKDTDVCRMLLLYAVTLFFYFMLLVCCYFVTESSFQISSTYSLIVRSEENLPALAVFIIAMRAHPL